MRWFNVLVPVFDYLYIYQVGEYNFKDFLKWFLMHPFARNLQKKKRLVLTKKVYFYLGFLIIWEIILPLLISQILFKNLYFAIAIWFLSLPLTPIYLFLAHLTYLPLDLYFKEKILSQAAKKLSRLPDLIVVAITGSFGKTSTKEMLYTLLVKNFQVVKTPKSFNTPMGIAQTIIEDLKVNTQIFIVEVGAYRRGEIAKLAQFLKPKLGLITAVGPQHLERFGSLENIALAKFELAEYLISCGNTVILNGENDYLVKLGSQKNGKVVFYGRDSDPIYASSPRLSNEGSQFILHVGRGVQKIELPLYGEHHIQNFLAAASIALRLGLPLSTIAKRANLLLPTPHRLQIKKQDGLVILDNTYNTNPFSAQVSLDLLKKYPGKQKIVITPGLVELGIKTREENELFGVRIAQVADLVILVGNYAKSYLKTGLKRANFPSDKTFYATSTATALAMLNQLARKRQGIVALIENDLPDQYS